MRFLNRLPEYVLAIQQCAEPRISIAFLVASCLDTCELQGILVVFLQHVEFVRIACQDDCIVSRMKNSAKMRKIISNLKTFPRCARGLYHMMEKWGGRFGEKCRFSKKCIIRSSIRVIFELFEGFSVSYFIKQFVWVKLNNNCSLQQVRIDLMEVYLSKSCCYARVSSLFLLRPRQTTT